MTFSRFLLPALVWGAAWPSAQATSAAVTAPPPLALDTWRQCAATTDNQARLACFDAWAQQQEPLTPPPATQWSRLPAEAAASGAAMPTAAAGAAVAGFRKLTDGVAGKSETGAY